MLKKNDGNMIKILIVEDSVTVSRYLEFIFGNDPEIVIIGSVLNGKQAVDFVKKNKPDIISMDIDMPIMNGLEATKIIMSENPIPIIIATASRNAGNIHTSMEALAAGALSVIQKPYGIGHPLEATRTARLLSMIKTLSKVKVVTRKYSKTKSIRKIASAKPAINDTMPPVTKLLNRKLVAIGISSGGPQVLAKIFSGISENFPYPILIVQHITEGFINSMVSWLNSILSIPVKVAAHNEMLLSGHIYFAPDKYQMGVKFNKIELRKCEPKTPICPSVKYLFNNLAQHSGKNTIAMILTGMGSDGSKEIKTLKNAGAFTIAQDEESSLVHGMPGEAIKNDGVDYVLNTNQIKDILAHIEKYK